MRPLDRLRSIKVKLGVVIVATVAGTVVGAGDRARELGLSLGAARRCWPRCSALAMVQFLARGMTSPLREMAAAATRDGARRLRPPRARDLARRGRRAGARVQRDGGRARRRRPHAARPGRQRLARAAHADRRAAGAAREPRRRRRAARPRGAADGARADRAARAAGRAAARPLAAGERRAGAASRRRSRVRALLEQATRECELGEAFTRPVWLRGLRAARRPARRRRPRADAPGRREPARQRGPPLARRTAACG